jgi:hypothetical protein
MKVILFIIRIQGKNFFVKCKQDNFVWISGPVTHTIHVRDGAEFKNKLIGVMVYFFNLQRK